MAVRTRSARQTRSRLLHSATTNRSRAQAIKLGALPVRRQSLRSARGRRKSATAPPLPSKRITSPCDSAEQSQETATTDKRSTSPNRAAQPRFTSPDNPKNTIHTLQWLRTSNRTHLEGWLESQTDPHMLLDPKTPPRTTTRKVEDLCSFQEPERGRRTRRALQREVSYNSTSTQWRTGIDNMSPAPSLAPKGLTRNLGMSPEKTRRMPP